VLLLWPSVLEAPSAGVARALGNGKLGCDDDEGKTGEGVDGDDGGAADDADRDGLDDDDDADDDDGDDDDDDDDDDDVDDADDGADDDDGDGDADEGSTSMAIASTSVVWPDKPRKELHSRWCCSSSSLSPRVSAQPAHLTNTQDELWLPFRTTAGCERWKLLICASMSWKRLKV